MAIATSPRSAPVTDRGALAMLEAYWDEGMDGMAVFELVVRRMPPRRSFLIAAGLAQAVELLLGLHVDDEEIRRLSADGGLPPDFLASLRDLRFTGDLDAMPEGTPCFADEPLLRVRAPIREAQLVERRLLGLVHFGTLIASKAVRCALAAPGRRLIETGTPRAHGPEAAVHAARAAYLAGFAATTSAEAGGRFGIPVSVAMSHAYVQAHDDEAAAFAAFAHAYRDDACLLIDTYDAARAAHEVVRIAPSLAADGVPVRSVRIDAGDLDAEARRVRAILDAGGLGDTAIVVGGDLDEYRVRDLAVGGAPIDGFAVGPRVGTAADGPYLDCAFGLQEYDGRPRSRPMGRGAWPGCKQVLRRSGPDGGWAGDVVALEGEPLEGACLLEPVIRDGRLVAPLPGLRDVRRRVREEVAALPPWMRTLDGAGPAPVAISHGIRALAADLDAARGPVATIGA